MSWIPDRLFAHLGAHKTGSTFLQGIFLRYAGLLAEAGTHYIPREVFFETITRKNLQWGSDFDARIPELRGMVSGLLPSRRDGSLLVSDEAMSGHILGDPAAPHGSFYRDCDRPVELLKRGLGAGNMTVIFFIRSIDDFLESCYLQRVKQGSGLGFGAYVSGFDLDRISWLPTIGKLRAPLGEGDRLLVYDHRSLKEDPRGVLADLFGRMGAPFPPEHRFGKRVNESFTPRQYKAVMGLNRIWPAGHFRAPRKTALKVLRALRSGEREKMRFFPPGVRRMLVERHRMETEAIRSMGGIVECYPSRP